MVIMKFRFLLISAFSLSLCVSLQAQTTKNEMMQDMAKAGSNYYSYPVPKNRLTPAPAGYKPFYISHYGRHGSRYMTNNKPYVAAIALLDSAERCGKITNLGRDVLRRLRIAYADAKGRDGDLTPLGARQHQGIAQRMFRNYPEIFAHPVEVDAKSSTVRRCILSMSNFCGELRALNPQLKVSMDGSEHDYFYLVNDKTIQYPHPVSNDSLFAQLARFKKKMFRTDRLMSTFFTDANFVGKEDQRIDLMDGLYNIAEDMQCRPELNLSFTDLFTKDELFDIWQVYNAGWCLWEGLMPGSSPSYLTHYPLLENIFDTADRVIREGKPCATLRFGHDDIVLPTAFNFKFSPARNATDDMDNLYKTFAISRIIPMAANIQLVFYRKTGSSDILVKFLLNERETDIPVKTDCAPFYHWKDVEAYYRGVLKQDVNR